MLVLGRCVNIVAMEEPFVKWGLDVVRMLAKAYGRIRKFHQGELARIGDHFGPPDELARYYVEPDCQSISPADTDEEGRGAVARGPMLQHIKEFFEQDFSYRDGSTNLFVLADAGMGKSSLLVMLKLLHLGSFWPQRYRCVLLKLGSDTLKEIEVLHDKSNTILLLDSLDEDPEARGSRFRIKERLFDLLEATQPFRRTVITCRTQYLPSERGDVFEREGWVQIGPYRCPAMYLSLFTPRQVDAYIRRRYPRSFFQWLFLIEHPKHARARELCQLMRSLKCRPMLLAYIEDFLSSSCEFSSEREMYKALVDAWLMREERTLRKLDSCIGANTAARLREAVTALAVYGQIKDVRYFSRQELSIMSGYAHLGDVGLEDVDLGGRSLMTMTSDKQFRFAHFSFQEFLVSVAITETPEDVRGLLEFIDAEPALEGAAYRPTERSIRTGSQAARDALEEQARPVAPRWTPLLARFVLQGTRLRGAYLPTAALGREVLKGADFCGADLRHASLADAVLERACFRAANLQKASLRGASLQDAVLCGANLQDVDARRATFERADLRGADLRRAVAGPAGETLRQDEQTMDELSRRGAPHAGGIAVQARQRRGEGASFRLADLQDANLQESKMTCTNFERANLARAVLTGAEFCYANLAGANLAGADLTGADLGHANLEGANLSGADLTRAILTKAKTTNADFTGAVLTDVDARSTALRPV